LLATFKEILSDISTKVSGDDVDSVKASLKQLGALHNDTTDKLTSFGEENKEKRGNIQSLTKTVRSLEDERDNLQSDFNELKTKSDTMSEEMDEHIAFKSETLQRRRQGFVDKIKVVVSHPNFAKASEEYFTLPEKNDDGDFQWDTLKDDQLDSNLKELNRLQKIDYFGTPTTAKKVVDGSLNSQGNSSFDDRVANANTFTELKEIQDSLTN